MSLYLLIKKFQLKNLTLSKYKDLEIEVTKMWKLKTKAIPVNTIYIGKLHYTPMINSKINSKH